MSYQSGPRWKSGSWWYHCPVCQFKYPREDVRRRWDGQYVCKDDWEPRHPMDFLKGRKEKISVFPALRETVDNNMESTGIVVDTTTLKPKTPAGY